MRQYITYLFLIIFAQIFVQANVISIPINKKLKKEASLKKKQFLGNNKSRLLSDDMSEVSLSVDNIDNQIYTISVSLGIQEESLDLKIDTSISRLWIPNNECNIKDQFKNIYSCDQSDGCNLQSRDSFSYSNGKVRGQKGNLKIQVEDLPQIDYPFLHANQVIDINPALNFDGVIGLGVSNSQNNGIPLVLQYYQQKSIPLPVFSIYLDFDSDSELTIGGHNPDHMKEGATFSTHVVDPANEQWELKVVKYSFGQYLSSSDKFKGTVRLDSGSSFIGIDEPIFVDFSNFVQEQYQGYLNKNQQLHIFCNYTSQLPTIYFYLPDNTGMNKMYSLEPLFYASRIDNDLCILNLKAIDIEQTFSLGQPFIRKYLPLFSYEPLQVGFAQTDNVPSLDESSSDDDSFPVYGIVLIVLFIILFFAVIFLAYKLCKKQKQNKQMESAKGDVQIQNNTL